MTTLAEAIAARARARAHYDLCCGHRLQHPAPFGAPAGVVVQVHGGTGGSNQHMARLPAESCSDDHRTPAERDAAALAACADLAAYFDSLPVVPVDRLNIEAIYDRIQRRMGEGQSDAG